MADAQTIVLLTDFGSQDHFTGVMKGVMRSIAPHAVFIDLTHEIPPGDIRRAALLLWQAYRYFPAGTVFLCVIDPGVGTPRKSMLVAEGDYYFVGPDNGLFTYVLSPQSAAFELSNPKFTLAKQSSTFHGRDIFAPAAAHLANRVAPDTFGPSIPQPIRLPVLHLERNARSHLVGESLHADRFGNVLTSLGRFQPTSAGMWQLLPVNEAGPPPQEYNLTKFKLSLPHGNPLRFLRTFGEASPGECGFLVGSSGLIEIIANQANAQEKLHILPGTVITLQPDLGE